MSGDLVATFQPGSTSERVDFDDHGFVDDASLFGHHTRIEQMDDDHVWIAVYSAEGSRERHAFQVYIRNGKLVIQQTEGPKS